MLYFLYMEHYGKEKKLYHGIVIPFILIVLVPIVLFILFRFVITQFVYYEDMIANYMAMTFTGIVTFLIYLYFIFWGFIHDLFIAMIDRIKDVFEFFDFGSKEAFDWYFYRFKQDGGIILWLYLLIFAANIVMCLFGAFSFFNWYNSL